MVTINIAAIAKFLGVGAVFFAMGQIIAFILAGCVTLFNCFVEWSWWPLRTWDWAFTRLIFLGGLLFSFSMCIFLVLK